ncbi:response regulator transcription factor [Massilia sp. TN1-12]|uniref:response regulator transcription factor n=1 Tax=Massilia paldalensis TaxID=3377675 RepID=UPI00384EE40C
MLHIVDDEDVIRDALAWLAQSRGVPARGHAGGQAFLDAIAAQEQAADAGAPGGAPGGAHEGDCVLLDVRMPGMNGIAVFDQLVARGLLARLPVIFLTGHGDVPMAVDSLKRGAFDFFEKPFNDNQLMDRVEEALAASRQAAASGAVRARLATLSAREREVLDLILAGNMNKVVADKLGISMRTVEVHRAHIFDKMQVKTAVELAGLLK